LFVTVCQFGCSSHHYQGRRHIVAAEITYHTACFSLTMEGPRGRSLQLPVDPSHLAMYGLGIMMIKVIIIRLLFLGPIFVQMCIGMLTETYSYRPKLFCGF